MAKIVISMPHKIRVTKYTEGIDYELIEGLTWYNDIQRTMGYPAKIKTNILRFFTEEVNNCIINLKQSSNNLDLPLSWIKAKENQSFKNVTIKT